MNENEICSGCSQHVANCICCTGIGPDGAFFSRPNPCNRAGKFKVMAQHARTHQVIDNNKLAVITTKARQAANQGHMSTKIWFTDVALTKPEAEDIVKALERDGFVCLISKEITAWYSNTDWDEDYQLTISWG